MIAIAIVRFGFVDDILFPPDFLTLVVDGLQLVRCLHDDAPGDGEEQQRDERRAETTFCNALGDIGHDNGLLLFIVRADHS